MARPGRLAPDPRPRPGSARVLSVAWFRALLRPPPARITNQALLVALVLVFGTGVATVATGSPSGRWAAVTHGVAGMAILLLIPWKSRVVRGGLRRARRSRWASLLLAVLIVTTLIAGLGYATGLVRSIAGRPGLWVHIAVALVLVPLALWHIPRPADPPATFRPVAPDLLEGRPAGIRRSRNLLATG
jgi:hypothetical protein